MRLAIPGLIDWASTGTAPGMSIDLDRKHPEVCVHHWMAGYYGCTIKTILPFELKYDISRIS